MATQGEGCEYERFFEVMAQLPLEQFEEIRELILENPPGTRQQIQLAILGFLQRCPSNLNMGIGPIAGSNGYILWSGIK